MDNLPELSRPCPVCGSAAAELFLVKGPLRLVRCRECSMVYASPLPAAFASADAYNEVGTEYYLSPAKLESDYAPVRFRRELRLFRRYCRGGAVLDVGCGTGGWLFGLERRYPGAYRRLGTDASAPALDYAASRGVPVARGDFPKQSFPEASFDALTFWAVLEHVRDPGAFLKRAAALLQPEGRCFVLVPNMRSLAARLLGARYRYVYPQHLNYFTRATLSRLVAKHFVIVEQASTHFNPVVIWQDWRRGGQEVSNYERGELLKRTTAYKQNPLLKPVKCIYDAFEWSLGRMNLADNLVMVGKPKTL